jgi:hypothetical protein
MAKFKYSRNRYNTYIINTMYVLFTFKINKKVQCYLKRRKAETKFKKKKSDTFY